MAALRALAVETQHKQNEMQKMPAGDGVIGDVCIVCLLLHMLGTFHFPFPFISRRFLLSEQPLMAQDRITASRPGSQIIHTK